MNKKYSFFTRHDRYNIIGNSRHNTERIDIEICNNDLYLTKIDLRHHFLRSTESIKEKIPINEIDSIKIKLNNRMIVFEVFFTICIMSDFNFNKNSVLSIFILLLFLTLGIFIINSYKCTIFSKENYYKMWINIDIESKKQLKQMFKEIKEINPNVKIKEKDILRIGIIILCFIAMLIKIINIF